MLCSETLPVMQKIIESLDVLIESFMQVLLVQRCSQVFNSNGCILIAATLTFLLCLPSVRLELCHTNLIVECQGVNDVKNYLDNPFGPSNENLEVKCDVHPNNPLNGWSLSPNGAASEKIMINTSLAKYTVSENTLHINGVDASDEGLYRCVYESGNTKNLCIYVHSRAVFASCPSTRSYDGCSEPENISVTAGEDIHFNASIIHIPGGNCGFKQKLSYVDLRNCSNIDCTSITGNDRISATMSPDIKRHYILSRSTIEDSGIYHVVVWGTNPQTKAQSTPITKIYRVTVKDTVAPSTTIATTEEEETAAITLTDGTSFLTATTDETYTSRSTTIIATTNYDIIRENAPSSSQSTTIATTSYISKTAPSSSQSTTSATTNYIISETAPSSSQSTTIATTNYILLSETAPSSSQSTTIATTNYDIISETAPSSSQSTTIATTNCDINETAPSCKCSTILCVVLYVLVPTTVTVMIIINIIIALIILYKRRNSKLKGSAAEMLQLSTCYTGDIETGCGSSTTSDGVYATDHYSHAQSSNEQVPERNACNGDVLPQIQVNNNMQVITNPVYSLNQEASNTRSEVLQRNSQNSNASSSDGISTPAPEQQSNGDQDIINESQKIESSPDAVGELCSPSESQQLKLRALQQNYQNNANSSDGTSSPAPKQQSNDDQDIISESQRIESSPRPGDVGEPCSPSESQQLKLRESQRVESSPVDVDEPCDHSESQRLKLRAPQQNFQNNTNSSDGTSSPAPEQQSNSDQDIISESQRIESSDDVGEPCSPSEDQRLDTENSPEDVGEQGGPSEIQQAKRSREGLKLDLSSRPTLPDLMNHVAAKTPTKWMVLGIQLGLEAAQLQALDHQHRGKSDIIFADMFDYWGKSSGLKPVTWSTMIEALKSPSVGEIALAHLLESTALSTCSDGNNTMDDGWPQQSQE